jgi:hypothetical protein
MRNISTLRASFAPISIHSKDLFEKFIIPISIARARVAGRDWQWFRDDFRAGIRGVKICSRSSLPKARLELREDEIIDRDTDILLSRRICFGGKFRDFRQGREFMDHFCCFERRLGELRRRFRKLRVDRGVISFLHCVRDRLELPKLR